MKQAPDTQKIIKYMKEKNIKIRNKEELPVVSSVIFHLAFLKFHFTLKNLKSLLHEDLAKHTSLEKLVDLGGNTLRYTFNDEFWVN